MTRRPRRVWLGGAPFILFRDATGLRCLLDRCPHRAAPLSEGRVIDGLIECPYHGWRFDGAGLCRAMPGLAGDSLPRIAVPTKAVCETEGLIFLADERARAQNRDTVVEDPAIERTPPYVCAMPAGDRIMVIAESRVEAALIDVAENILDATHTHFTHKALLRGLSGRRRRIAVTLSAGEGWVEARYEGEAMQDGLISRLLEGGRTISIGRFRYPGIAELEFRGPRGINLATTFHLREAEPGVTRGLAVLAGPSQGGFGRLKAALFMPLFGIALRQDQRILEACASNCGRHRERDGEIAPLVSPLDILRPHLAAILAGRRPALGATSLTMEL